MCLWSDVVKFLIIRISVLGEIEERRCVWLFDDLLYRMCVVLLLIIRNFFCGVELRKLVLLVFGVWRNGCRLYCIIDGIWLLEDEWLGSVWKEKNKDG